MGIVITQMLLDAALRRIEERVEGSARVLVTEIYKELTTLGIISFILFLVQTFADSFETEMLHAFEFSHILTFSFALCYILQSSVMIHSIGPLRRDLVKLNTMAMVADDQECRSGSISVGVGGSVSLSVQEGEKVEEEQGREQREKQQKKKHPNLRGGTVVPKKQQQKQKGQRTSCWPAWLCRGGGCIGVGLNKFYGFQEFRHFFLEQHELPLSFLYDRYLMGTCVCVCVCVHLCICG